MVFKMIVWVSKFVQSNNWFRISYRIFLCLQFKFMTITFSGLISYIWLPLIDPLPNASLFEYTPENYNNNNNNNKKTYLNKSDVGNMHAIGISDSESREASSAMKMKFHHLFRTKTISNNIYQYDFEWLNQRIYIIYH